MKLYQYVRVVAPGMSLRRREALVAAARSLGLETSVDAEIRELRTELAAAPEPVPSRAEARQRVAETATAIEAKRERVATLRGRMQETDDGTVSAEYRAAIRSLSEVETEHAAAKETLADARQRARAARNVRDRRLQLEDRLANAERTARQELLESIRPKLDGTIPSVPDSTADGFEDAGPISAALALARVGRVERPIVLACDRFSDRGCAERWLCAPVYRITP